jgi:hypothetical protein
VPVQGGARVAVEGGARVAVRGGWGRARAGDNDGGEMTLWRSPGAGLLKSSLVGIHGVWVEVSRALVFRSSDRENKDSVRL